MTDHGLSANVQVISGGYNEDDGARGGGRY